jgi:hypothetical protein
VELSPFLVSGDSAAPASSRKPATQALARPDLLRVKHSGNKIASPIQDSAHMSFIDPDFYMYCLRHHREMGDMDFVVRKSLPIPYFGDVAAYASSPLKVLTAALNPSGKEFPADNPRFDIAGGLRGADELEVALRAYFKFNPYRAWFGSFEPVLSGLGASYGGKMADRDYRHTALHLDMCSPIATSPTWSRLSPQQRSKLTATGRDIFERLVDALKPDIIIASLGWEHIEYWHADFRTGRSWKPILTYTTSFNSKPLKTPLRVQANFLSSRMKHVYLFANGSAANTPFGRFHTDRKREAGAVLLGQLRSRQ